MDFDYGNGLKAASSKKEASWHSNLQKKLSSLGDRNESNLNNFLIQTAGLRKQTYFRFITSLKQLSGNTN